MMQDKSVGLGVESSSNSGIQKLSSMFSVALHSGLDAALQKIKMTIKGDPFWLTPQPFTDERYQIYNSLKTDADAIDAIKNKHFTATDAVNIYGSDNFIIVRFRTPRVFNTDANTEDGSSAYNEVETFSGVYKVTNMTARFENGKFTQDMECILDPELRILDFIKEIEADAKKLDVPTTVSDLTTLKNTFPNTAIKTQKIMGAAEATQTLASIEHGARNTGSNIPIASANILPGMPNQLT
jgi:hypothetical protein